jgi:Fic family protein
MFIYFAPQSKQVQLIDQSFIIVYNRVYKQNTMSLKAILTKRLNINPDKIHEIISLLSKIDSIKSQWTSENNLTSFTIDELSKNNIITSAGASNRIENIILTDKQVNTLFLSKKKDHFKRNEAEVMGYIDILQTVFEEYENIKLNQSNILSLHNELLKFSDSNLKYSSRYKLTDNQIALANQQGEILGILFKPTPAHLTQQEMGELIEWVESESNKKIVHPLIITAIFIIEFLAIHPFDDGNGRVSRVLSILLLLQNGYDFTKYVSHEKMIEQTRDKYYKALRDSQSNWRQENEDVSEWILYFLRTVLKQAAEAINLLDFDNFEEHLSPQQIVFWSEAKKLKTFTRSEINSNTGLPLSTINQAIKKLTKLGKIKPTGSGSSTKYTIV